MCKGPHQFSEDFVEREAPLWDAELRLGTASAAFVTCVQLLSLRWAAELLGYGISNSGEHSDQILKGFKE